MNKAISTALLAAGIVLMVYGANASDSLGSSVSRFFTGSPTDKTVWLLVGGLVSAIVGFFGLFRRSN
jgi:hypothetical protein